MATITSACSRTHASPFNSYSFHSHERNNASYVLVSEPIDRGFSDLNGSFSLCRAEKKDIHYKTLSEQLKHGP